MEVEWPPEDKEPKLPSIVVSLIGNETEEEKQTRSKKQENTKSSKSAVSKQSKDNISSFGMNSEAIVASEKVKDRKTRFDSKVRSERK